MERVKIFLAIVFGGLIGMLVAVRTMPFFITDVPLWLCILIGAPIGGLVGYLSFSPKENIVVIRQAWHLAVNWRPDKERLRSGWTIGLFYLALMSYAPVLSVVLSVVIGEPKGLLENYVVAGFLILGFLGLYFALGYCLGKSPKDYEVYIVIAKKVNPAVVLGYYLPWAIFWLGRKIILNLPTAIWLTLRGIGSIGVALPRFIKFFFLLIHSEQRLICGFYAATSVVAGCLTGDWLLWLLLCGIAGVISRETVYKRLHQPA